jgi:hypothetical protein
MKSTKDTKEYSFRPHSISVAWETGGPVAGPGTHGGRTPVLHPLRLLTAQIVAMGEGRSVSYFALIMRYETALNLSGRCCVDENLWHPTDSPRTSFPTSCSGRPGSYLA